MKKNECVCWRHPFHLIWTLPVTIFLWMLVVAALIFFSFFMVYHYFKVMMVSNGQEEIGRDFNKQLIHTFGYVKGRK